MLPSDVPRPLSIAGARESAPAERAVRVRWPAKRTSVGDMNKRVRALVEWVGREQAAAEQRVRRVEALKDAMDDEGRGWAEVAAALGVGDDATAKDGLLPTAPGIAMTKSTGSEISAEGKTTMQLAEELMQDLISFQVSSTWGLSRCFDF
jgi:hypothetical protein